MHTVLVWAHVGLMMVAFGASPLGRLGLRHLLSRASDAQATHAIVRGFSGIFLAGGISVTVSFFVGLALAWNGSLTQTWITVSIALIVIAGVAGVVIEERWMKRLTRAEGDDFTTILNERVPLWVALASPLLWLCILWLMIERPV